MKILKLVLLFTVVFVNGMDKSADKKRKKPCKPPLNVQIEKGAGNIFTGPSLSRVRPDISNGW